MTHRADQRDGHQVLIDTVAITLRAHLACLPVGTRRAAIVNVIIALLLEDLTIAEREAVLYFVREVLDSHEQPARTH
jgi:hypothetical protein